MNKNMKLRKKILSSKLSIITSVSLGLCFHSQAQTSVDTELLLLVDVSGSVNTSEYNLMMGGYSEAFRSQAVVDSIQTGSLGSIAVSLVFWSGAAQQSTGVAWTKIDSLQSAIDFADAIDSVSSSRPYSASTAVGSALTMGATTFGTETGNTENGFSSAAQVIDISGDGEDNNTPITSPTGDRESSLQDSRDGAMASGVDMINGLTIGNAGGDLEGYYNTNVISGSSGGVAAFTQTAATFADVETSLNTKLQREIEAGAKIGVVAVPEPSTTALIGLAGMLMILKRRKIRFKN